MGRIEQANILETNRKGGCEEDGETCISGEKGAKKISGFAEVKGD